MMRSVLLVFVLCACGESSRVQPSATSEVPFVPPACAAEPLPPCVDDGPFHCAASVGYGFIGALYDTDNRSTASMSIPDPRTICLSGTVAAIDGDEPWVEMVLGVDERGAGGTCIRAVYDARALGATSFAFDLDAVPDTHLVVHAAVVQQAECPEGAYLCVEGGVYTLYTHDRQELALPVAGANRAAFSDFVGDDLTEPLDASRLSLFTLRLTPTLLPVDFNFCVNDLAFLDDAGREVAPPSR
jgi:hypothetical protein